MTEQEARDFLTALGAEVTYWRKRRGLTRAQLAQRVGVSETTIGRIERADATTAASATDLWRLSAILEIPLSKLVGRAEDATEPKTRVDIAWNHQVDIELAAHPNEGRIDEGYDQPGHDDPA